MLKHKSKRLLNKHNYTEICLRLNTWYTISGVHNTNQIQTLKTLEFLRYESYYEILSELWCENNFSSVLAIVKLLWVSYNHQVFTPLDRGVKETLLIASTSKRVVVVAWFGYCPMKEQFQIHSKNREQPA